MIEKTDPQILKELASEADDLLANRAFDAAIKTLHRQWYGELVNDATDDSKVPNLRAKLQALEAIPQLLRGLMRGPNVR